MDEAWQSIGDLRGIYGDRVMNNLQEKIKKDTEEAIKRVKESEKYLDKIRGSLIGGAAGDPR